MRAIVISLFLFFTFAITACGSSNEPVNLNGAWAADGFSAHISGDNILIDIVNKETSATYWDGTVPFPLLEEEFVSVANQEVLKKSLFGSRDSTKLFTYDDGDLSFVFTIMGNKRVIHLSRV